MAFYRDKKTWNVSIWNGSSWVADGTIPSPGITPIEEPLKGTTEIIKLADGSEAKVTPETKYNLGSMTLTFSRFDLLSSGTDSSYSTIKNKLLNYAKNGTGLKLFPGLVGPYDYYEGYLDTSSTRWLLERGHGNEIRMQQQVKLKLFDIDADGVIISGTDIAL